MLHAGKPKGGFGWKKAFSIVLIVCLVFSQMIFVNAWQPDNGNGTFNNPPLYADYPDPSIVRVGSDFYMASSTFAGSPGLVILHSQDLVNWEIISHCISSFPSGGAYDMIGGLKYGNGCFAPGLAYYNGTFYVAVTPNGEATRIYHATNPAGPWTYNQLSGGYFDPCLFFDNGTPYLVWGGAWENSIKIIQLNSTLSGTTGSQSTILSYNGLEGSHLVKANGYYYLINAVPGSLSCACSRSTTLKGPYSGTNTVCNDSRGGHQGGIVDMPDGSYWYYLMKDSGAIGRVTYIAPVTWSNGWPQVGSGSIASSYTKPIANKPVMVPATSDEFNGSSFGNQWIWNHNPDNSKWSMTGSALRLKATTGSDFWHARNSLTQKGQGPTSSGTIKIDCSAIQNGDICGLGMLGDPRGYIAVTKDSSGKKIIMSEEESVKGTATGITATTLYFRIEMDFGTKYAKFFWRDDSTTTWKQLGTTITMGFDWQNGTFQGEQYAILNFNTGSSSGYVDVDWFRLNDVPGPGGNQTPTPTPTPSTATATPTPTPVPGTATPTPVPGTATPTPTPGTATATPTPTTGTPVPGGIKVQFFNGNTAATTNTIYPNFKVVNTGTASINLSDIKMRYYFTNDGTQADSFACDYSTVGAGNITSSFTTIAKTNADRYLEVGFTSAAGTLAAGASAEVKGRIWKSDWSNFTQTGDYSFNATATNYVDATTVTGWLAGALKWGTEP